MGLKKHLYSLMPQYNPSSLMPQSLVCAKYMNALLILIIQASPKKIVRFGLQVDKANIQKKKDEEKALKELRAKAQKGALGGTGLKKSGKK